MWVIMAIQIGDVAIPPSRSHNSVIGNAYEHEISAIPAPKAPTGPAPHTWAPSKAPTGPAPQTRAPSLDNASAISLIAAHKVPTRSAPYARTSGECDTMSHVVDLSLFKLPPVRGLRTSSKKQVNGREHAHTQR